MTTMNYGTKEQLTTNKSDVGAKCAVCSKHKFQLRARKSKLNGNQMFVCNTCFEGKYEPRWLVILTAQAEGMEAVRDYILNHKYDGAEIPAADLIN